VGVARLVLDRQSCVAYQDDDSNSDCVPYQDDDSNSGAYIWMHA